MPVMRWRVVCALRDVILTFWPTSAFISVDLPTFGRPTIATMPQRKPEGVGAFIFGYREFRKSVRRVWRRVNWGRSMAGVGDTLRHVGESGFEFGCGSAGGSRFSDCAVQRLASSMT